MWILPSIQHSLCLCIHTHTHIHTYTLFTWAWCWPPTPSKCQGHERVGVYLYSPSGPQWSVIGRTFTFTLPIHFLLNLNMHKLYGVLCCDTAHTVLSTLMHRVGCYLDMLLVQTGTPSSWCWYQCLEWCRTELSISFRTWHSVSPHPFIKTQTTSALTTSATQFHGHWSAWWGIGSWVWCSGIISLFI